MQTFLPYADFRTSATSLDRQRLGKQIVEAKQILKANMRYRRGWKSGWQSHPATKMWRGFESCLVVYHNACVDEWHARGYDSHHHLPVLSDIVFPDWLGDQRLHFSHQCNLVRKNPDFYGPQFPDANPDEPYFWPTT